MKWYDRPLRASTYIRPARYDVHVCVRRRRHTPLCSLSPSESSCQHFLLVYMDARLSERCGEHRDTCTFANLPYAPPHLLPMRDALDSERWHEHLHQRAWCIDVCVTRRQHTPSVLTLLSVRNSPHVLLAYMDVHVSSGTCGEHRGSCTFHGLLHPRVLRTRQTPLSLLASTQWAFCRHRVAVHGTQGAHGVQHYAQGGCEGRCIRTRSRVRVL